LSTTDELTVKARYLRNAAPQAYLDFVSAFTAYTDRKYSDLVSATVNLQQAQGHAQQCRLILQVLEGVRHG
jgi:hypothetical protein